MIPGLSARRGNQLALTMLAGLGLLGAYAWRQAAADRQSLQAYGALVRAAISYQQYQKGGPKLTVNYKYNGHYYYNTLQAGKLAYKAGDSITIRINAQNPAGYCALAADSRR